MTTFESNIKQVQAPQSAVYAKLSDLNNLAQVKDRLPEHKVKNMTFDADTLSMQAPPIGTITLKIVAREPESCITFGTTSSPLPFDLQIHLSPVSDAECQLKLTINMEVNPFIKNMIQRPLQDGLEKMADLLAMALKLWEKSVQINKDIERFTVGRDREMDLYLAKYDVLGSMAHITMLESIGLLTADELQQLLAEMKSIYAMAERDEFVIEDGVEDVHSQVELMLTRRLGDMGKKIHSGRSRNDQVLLDLKLFTRAQLKETAEAVEQLFTVLIQQSERYKDVLMPGYTHLQVAMPSSFGLWFGAYAESLADDMLFLQAAYKTCNRNPLGSAAGYGSSFPLNRTMTTELLGFDSMNYNVVYAQMGRGKMERNVTFALATIAGTLRNFCLGHHRRHVVQAGLRCLPVQQPELRLREIARRLHHRLQHHAPQEESRRIRADACEMQ